MKRVSLFYFLTFKVLICLLLPVFLHSTEPEEYTKKATYFLSDKTVLENFFFDLFENTPGGYVLYGSKPVYLCNPSNEKTICIGTSWHEDCCAMWETVSVLKNFDPPGNQKEYVFHISSNTTDMTAFENEFLLINRDAFLSVVNENLPLFQYEMGLNLSAISLLNKLLDKNENISTLFKGKIALLGIILGYGTKNSISYERGVHILKSALASSVLFPPYRSDLSTDRGDVIEKCKISNVLPGFGYDLVSDEIQEILNSVGDSTDDCKDASTKIPFSYLKDSEESKDLLHMYEKAQSKVEKAMRSKSFLDNVLAKFNLKYRIDEQNSYSFDNDQIRKILPNLVARSILEHVSEINIGCRDNDYLGHFISGMKDAEMSNSCSSDNLEGYNDVMVFDDYQSERSRCPRIKRNLELADDYFKRISTQDNLVCIEPFKIYYKIIQNGDGEFINNKTDKVSMRYVIKDIEGKVLSGSYSLEPSQTFEVSKLMPGLIHGLQGMKKNEIREIFIHQDFSYNVDSDFSAGKALSVRVEVVEMNSGLEKIKLPELIPVGLLSLCGNTISSKSQLELLQKKYIAFCGFRTWLHYKKAAKLFTLNDILDSINKIQKDTQSVLLFDESSRKILRKFNLFLYNEL